jgi:hypothetical protein
LEVVVYVHVAGTRYRIVDGARCAKAAFLAGHDTIPAIVRDFVGLELGNCELPVDSLLSARETIPRKSQADEFRWKRAVAGANVWPLTHPPIIVIPVARGWPLADVTFDFGGSSS